jgi:hypothetical protein
LKNTDTHIANLHRITSSGSTSTVLLFSFGRLGGIKTTYGAEDLYVPLPKQHIQQEPVSTRHSKNKVQPQAGKMNQIQPEKSNPAKLLSSEEEA